MKKSSKCCLPPSPVSSTWSGVAQKKCAYPVAFTEKPGTPHAPTNTIPLHKQIAGMK